MDNVTDTPHDPDEDHSVHYDGPAGGWGSVRGMLSLYGKAWSNPDTLKLLATQNKPKGFMCSSCAWAKPAKPNVFEFCENGAKATLWEVTSERCGPDFWNDHTVTQLRDWKDHDLEMTGRLTQPLRYNGETDRYEAVSWDAAFAEIGATLNRLDPKKVVFYASGHAALEPSYLYALLARLYGTNNLPQSSNMCHETTSVGLKKVIGSPVGTVNWDDLAMTEAFFFFGQNTGQNSPRFLHPLQEAKKRGAKIVTFNPVREKGLVAFTNPQNPVQMVTGEATQMSDLYLQVKAGGDIAAIMGLCKVVLEADDAAKAAGKARILDTGFIDQHTMGAEEFILKARLTPWADIERESGLGEADLRRAGDIYVAAKKVIAVYGMGLTQQVHGSDNLGMLVNLMLLCGHIGVPGSGMCPVRGHSNVQGQRTVGIAEKTRLVPMDRLKALFDFDPPTEDGMNITEVLEALFKDEVQATLCLGGNLLRATPDQGRMEAHWPKQALTVVISTKLNRSHLFPGKASFILPCLGRTETDVQQNNRQICSIEDSFSNITASTGNARPPSEHLRSELAIIAGIAKATLPANPKVTWDDWTNDYGLVRDLIELTYPEDFRDYNKRLLTPGGFFRGNFARERIWKTETGKAMFTVPGQLHANGFEDAPGRFRLVTLRSNDQFNTTIYGYSDRMRGIEGTRDVLMISREEMQAAGLAEGDRVRLVTDIDDGHERSLGGLKVVPFDLPRNTVAAYYPEANVLVPVSHHDKLSKTPASKSVPVRIERETAQGLAAAE
ncbi:FdhF/YdeP family oxidoreductase [Asticcacaulis sp. EMRT-3]|uniref:FdhF/YdeP family oxidoreductase n=1 Tax=Asticcacaulis sp. EMRT-3 TaxID=3040349 RepID=UPI0024AF8B65|nr:FdhF/YdeP family oxidoreductase [Asticcacaulis sp. EMRT-3]MDI7776377.1 FdhF/YdeP family oxidoreductase [Asticcacaulis sp. EMRT-3]